MVLVLPGRQGKSPPLRHEGDVFTFTLTAEQSVYGRYELRTVGTDKAAHSVYFSAVSLADALRHGTTKGDEGEENRVLGLRVPSGEHEGESPAGLHRQRNRTRFYDFHP